MTQYAKHSVVIDGRVYNRGDILPEHASDLETLRNASHPGNGNTASEKSAAPVVEDTEEETEEDSEEETTEDTEETEEESTEESEEETTEDASEGAEVTEETTEASTEEQPEAPKRGRGRNK